MISSIDSITTSRISYVISILGCVLTNLELNPLEIGGDICEYGWDATSPASLAKRHNTNQLSIVNKWTADVTIANSTSTPQISSTKLKWRRPDQWAIHSLADFIRQYWQTHRLQIVCPRPGIFFLSKPPGTKKKCYHYGSSSNGGNNPKLTILSQFLVFHMAMTHTVWVVELPWQISSSSPMDPKAPIPRYHFLSFFRYIAHVSQRISPEIWQRAHLCHR